MNDQYPKSDLTQPQSITSPHQSLISPALSVRQISRLVSRLSSNVMSKSSLISSNPCSRLHLSSLYLGVLICGSFACSSHPQTSPTTPDMAPQNPTLTSHTSKTELTALEVQPTPPESKAAAPVALPTPVISTQGLPPLLSSQDLKMRLVGPKGVKRWEPSGVVNAEQSLWVVSDRGGWLARYQLPLRAGSNAPVEAHQLKPELKHRVKWEGLTWERNQQNEPTALLLLEAISRSVWRCENPHQGCPDLTQQPLDHLNPRLNQNVPTAFKYIMFEALAYHRELLVGVRGYQDQSRGLIPWSLLVSSQSRVKMDARLSFILDHRRYGVSGATYDDQRKGYWLTWSYEDESGSTQDAVGGVLSFTPLQKTPFTSSTTTRDKTLDVRSISLPSPQHDPFLICARFRLKPEGVTLNSAGDLFVIFDEDLDRKLGEITPQEAVELPQQRFALRDFEDFIWRASRGQVLRSCVSPSLIQPDL